MKFKTYIKKENKNKIFYIEYENGKTIELTRNNNHIILNDKNYIFLIINGTKENQILHKVFDIKNRRFLTKSIDMQILYNNYKNELNKLRKKQNKKKILKK